MGAFANSEDLDEKPQNALCGISPESALLAMMKLMFREKNTIFLEIITGDPSICTMDHPDFIVCLFVWFGSLHPSQQLWSC